VGARATRAKEKATLISERGLYLCRQLPTLPHTFACSTIGPAGLNFRVRDGNGWNPRGKITDKSRRLAGVNEPPQRRQLGACCRDPERFMRGISTPSRCRFRDDIFQQRASPSAAEAANIGASNGTAKAVPLQSRARPSVLKHYFKDPEDEASQLNRLGETRQAASLLQSVFVGAQSSVLVVFRVASSF
jgi:hypothetical protein